MAIIGLRFAADRSFYPRLVDGKNQPTARKTGVVVQRFSDAWPANASWPPEVPRPGPTGSALVSDRAGF